MNSRELKRRISTVKDTVKITRAMQMIAASKLFKSRQKSDASYAYVRQLERILSEADEPGIDAHELLRGNASDKVALIVIAGDKGLCGDYNHRVLALADEVVAEKGAAKVYAIGQEAREHFLRLHIPVSNFYAHMASEPHAFDAISVANDMLEHYKQCQYGEIYLAYTRTPTYTRMEPCVKKLLPIERKIDAKPHALFEPHTSESVTNFLTQYLMAQIYSALADSVLAMNYKRMLSMQESTKNGEKIIAGVSQEYNHRRQESITNELVTASSSTHLRDQL